MDRLRWVRSSGVTRPAWHAAYACPKDVGLDVPDSRTVDIPAVDQVIRTAATALEQTGGDELATARSAAQVYLDWPDYTTTAQGRFQRGSTYRALEEVLGWLAEHGTARAQPTLGPTVHQPTEWFRVLVGDEADDAAYLALTAVRAEETARVDEPSAATTSATSAARQLADPAEG